MLVSTLSGLLKQEYNPYPSSVMESELPLEFSRVEQAEPVTVPFCLDNVIMPVLHVNTLNGGIRIRGCDLIQEKTLQKRCIGKGDLPKPLRIPSALISN